MPLLNVTAHRRCRHHRHHLSLYLFCLQVWDEFPNGRWGDGRSPAFGDLSVSHFYQFAAGSREDRRAMWGEAPIEEGEVWDAFAQYVEGKVSFHTVQCKSIQCSTYTLSCI
jgi:hypothetical protein